MLYFNLWKMSTIVCLGENAWRVMKYPNPKYRKLQGRHHQEVQDEPLSSKVGLWSRLHPSLQQGYKYCFAIVSTIWILCFVFTVWVGVSHQASPGLVYTLQTGSCATIRDTNFWIHLLINILASALYGVSSYVMQRLAAPTREDVDKAHSAQGVLKIGSLAIRNLALLGRRRWMVFAFLWASSLPIHLVFNSIIVYSSANAEWPSYALLLSEPQLDSFQHEQSVFATSGIRQSDQISGLGYDEPRLLAPYVFHQQPPLVELTLSDCIETFGSGSSETWGDVILVHELRETDPLDNMNTLKEPVILSTSYVPATLFEPWSWMCGSSTTCDTSTILQNDTWTIGPHLITRCLGRKLPELCELNASLSIAIIVLICISCKLICIFIAVSLGRSQSLLTVGDAVASFLQEPDVASPKYSLLHSGRRNRVMTEMKYDFWESTIFGLAGLSLSWWFFSFTFSETRAAYVNSKVDFNFATMLRFGLGEMPTMWTNKLRTDLLSYRDAENPSFTYTSGATLANLPQLALSTFYLVFNNYVTNFFVALEFRRFSTRRQGLRVSQPSQGTKQRRAHFLQIPLRYSLLMMAIFILLHTFLSQTLFLRRVYAIYPQSFDDPNDIGKKLIPMIGYSPVSCFALAILLTALVVSGIVIGLIPMDWRFPDTSGSSLAISATCHPPEGTENSHEGEVRWGVTNKNAGGTVKCSFSLLPVRPPDVGEVIVIVNSDAESS
ncbi:hypothetical protein F5B19DRAFT_214298 [Rostrohypoxylon terebratum]|nr:hypothetical protein F5B19DRAFT_214298 [Rostrohypoxylon terebratum]